VPQVSGEALSPLTIIFGTIFALFFLIDFKKGYIMQVNSSEVVMTSQHSFSRTQTSSVSFESYVQLDNSNESDETAEVESTNAVANSSPSENDDQKTIEDILNELLNKLSLNKDNSNMSADDITKEVDKAIGYSHLSMYSSYEEHESVNINTTASIKTNQGSMDLNLNYSMSRDFVVKNQVDVYSLTDPLIVNLDGDMPTLSKDTFNFDIDNDGESDQISKLGKNSGFLALDNNNDGIINQGSELFGTKTGDGFGELSAYDDDKNGWIDENDDIFDKLQIWLKNDENTDDDKQLFGLGESGIGAIYLGSTDSDFTYKTDENQTLGQLKSSGFFLNNNMTTGSIFQIDLNKTTTPKTESSPLADLLK